ncbi:MAG: hypothetical protein ACK55I_18690, partial [bacterium]
QGGLYPGHQGQRIGPLVVAHDIPFLPEEHIAVPLRLVDDLASGVLMSMADMRHPDGLQIHILGNAILQVHLGVVRDFRALLGVQTAGVG